MARIGTLRDAVEELIHDGDTVARGSGTGAATLCIGVGQGLALVLER